jgi:hypothetical protein
MKWKWNLSHYLIRITSQHVHLRTGDSESNTRVSESNNESSRIVHVFSSFGDGTIGHTGAITTGRAVSD